MRWRKVSLASVSKSVSYGYTASASEEQVGPKFLRITDIVPEYLDWNSVPYCRVNERDQERFSLEPGDIVVARTGATVGYAKQIRNVQHAVFASYLVRFRIDSEAADPQFVGRLVESAAYKRFVISQVGGAAQPNANAKVLGRFEFGLPTRLIQRRIASILTAYDDLIENNRRRIALLEEAARLLYREWFVYLRFPGHEGCEITDGLPSGWERRLLFEESHATYGHAFKSALFTETEEGLPVVRIRDVPNGISVTWTTEEAPADRYVTDGDFLIGMDGDFHMNFWSGGKAWLNQRVTRINSEGRMSVGFLRFALEEPIKRLNETITGTTVKHLGAKHLRQIEVIAPPDVLLVQANGFFENIRNAIVNLRVQNQELSKARDLLLSRLMYGEIAVRH